LKENNTKYILDLLASPINLTNYDEMFKCLERYLSHYAEVETISLVDNLEVGSKIYGDEIPDDIFKKILNAEKIPRKYLSSCIDIESTPFCAYPIYLRDDRYDWLVVGGDLDNKAEIFSDYFFKYIENVNLYRNNKEDAETLKVLATTDDVTGLYNQRKLTEDLEEAVKWHEKEHETFSIMFIDVDHFKSVNDDYGHIIGSKLLLDLGKALQLILRQTDHIYRYGGDEFVVIMPNVKTSIVHEVATRILGQLNNHFFDIDNGETYKMSLSIGIAEYPTDAKSAMEIIKFADEMMYKSKKSGRGKVFHVNEVANVDAGTK